MLSSSGFRDGLGERDLLFNRESGEVCERLFPRPELAAYESALRRRVGRLASIADPRLVPVIGVEHDRATARLAIVSRHVSGARLTDTLRIARERELIPDLTVSLFLAAEILAALHAFHSLSGIPHGVLTTNSIVTTAEGEVVIADYAYAEVIESARFAPRRLWREFGIAPWLGEPFSFEGDVRQAALASIALMLGRPLDGADLPEGLDALVAEVEEAAMIRGGRLFAEPVVIWLTRALGQTRDAFSDSGVAADECVKLLTDRERASARPALLQFFAELEAPPAPEPELEMPAVFEPELEVPPVSEPDAEFIPTEPAFEETLPPVSNFECVPPAPEFAPIPEPELAAVRDLAPASASVPEVVPVVSPEPNLEAVAPEPPAVAPPVYPEGESQPLKFDPTGTSPFDTSPIVSPSPFAPVQRGEQAAPVAPPALAAPPPAPPPTPAAPPAFPRLPITRYADVAPTAPPPPPTVTRESTPIRLKEPAPSKRPAMRAPLADRPAFEEASEQPRSGFRIPWKMAAAAAVVLVTGFAAANVDWSTKGEAAPPPGTLVVETTPPGSDVFLDGAAKGVTPAVLQVPPGRHEIKVKRKGAEHAWSVDIASSARRVERLDWTALHQTGGIEVISNSAGSKVLVDGKPRGVTPLVLGDLKPGRHTVVVQGPNGNVRRRVTVVAGETTKLDLAIYSGWIIVSAPIELQIVEKGKSIGNAGEGPIVLSAGPHTIELVNETLAYRSSHSIDIAPGEEERLSIAPKGVINVNAVPWAEVWLDGERVGDTPIASLEVPLGACELVLKHPEHGERRMAVTVTGGAPVQISVDFTAPTSP